MLSKKAAPGMALAIYTRLDTWYNGTMPLAAEYNFPDFNAAVQSQDALGWQAFFEGCLAVEWEGVQNAYLLWLGSKWTRKRWISALITKVWEVAWDMWENRCNILHEKDGPNDAVNVATLNAAVAHEFARGRENLPRRDRLHFTGTLDSLLVSPIGNRQAWLKNVQAARERFIRRQMGGLQQERAAMALWLGTAAPAAGEHFLLAEI